jgi:hypothetical protein
MQGTMDELRSTVARIIVSINTSEDQFADRVETPHSRPMQHSARRNQISYQCAAFS